MPDSEPHSRLHLRPLLVVAALLLGYLLSYAPVYRLTKPAGWSSVDRSLVVYRPVDWLIDNTPLDEPLYRWAGCWGVRGDFVWSAAARAFSRGEVTAIVNPEAETPHLYEHVVETDSAAGDL